MSTYKFVFDTETSGLPYRERGSNYDYTNLDHFNSSRLLSISWLLPVSYKHITLPTI